MKYYIKAYFENKVLCDFTEIKVLKETKGEVHYVQYSPISDTFFTGANDRKDIYTKEEAEKLKSDYKEDYEKTIKSLEKDIKYYTEELTKDMSESNFYRYKYELNDKKYTLKRLKDLYPNKTKYWDFPKKLTISSLQLYIDNILDPYQLPISKNTDKPMNKFIKTSYTENKLKYKCDIYSMSVIDPGDGKSFVFIIKEGSEEVIRKIVYRDFRNYYLVGSMIEIMFSLIRLTSWRV